MLDFPLRYRVAAGITAALFLVLWSRLFYLQVIEEAKYSAVAHENSIQIAVDVARRGLIFDRGATIIAQNDPSYSVYLMRPKARPLEVVVEQLAAVLDIDSAIIMNRLRSSRLPHFEPVRVARHISLETVCRIEEQHERLPGIMLQYETTRRYPDPAGGSHLLGYVDEPAPDTGNASGSSASFVGVRGVEKYFDYLLAGVNGVRYMKVTAAGQVVGESPDQSGTPSTPGQDLYLNIDWDLQGYCEAELEKRGTGAVICLEPKSGAVRAIVNVPSFDLNLFSGILKPETWSEVVNDTTHPLLDRALKGLYPPGSTTKLVTAAAGLETGLIAPTTRFSPCFGGLQVGNRYFRCWKPAGHGSLDLAGAIEHSCDVYFYQLAQRLGVERWAEAARKCGFGKVTGIDLPNESAGLVPDSAYYNRRFGERGWTSSLVLNLAIGQGEFLVTPLQLAVFYAAIANGGTAVQPRVLRHYITSGGMESVSPDIKYLPPLPMSAATIQLLQRSLRQVVASPEGTAHGLNYPDLEIAGKTGTAQNPHGDNHSWFACYAPSSDPQLVVVAIVENAGHGSEVAAPLCGDILRHYFGLPEWVRAPADTTKSPADSGSSGETYGF